jgi:ABC-type branched-subunit amino acid transport system substrate-binding protein
VEQVRKLVESDEVSFIFSQLGTPTNSAVAAYLIAKKVPSVGILSGSNKFDDLEKYPYTTTGLPSFDTEGRVYAKYLRRELPSGKIAILYQNDDLGRDYVNAFRSVYGDDFATRVVTASYEISAPTIDSQVVALKNTGAEALFIAGTSKFAAQAIRTVGEIGWKATLIINFPSGSVSATLVPAGLDKSIGIITATFSKDPSDARWKDDRDITFYRLILEKYLPGADIADTNYLIGVRQGMILEKLIKQCGNDLSRSNIIKQARELKDLVVPTVIPGIKVNTSASNNRFWTQLQLQRWNGSAWQAFGEILDANAQ